MNEDLEYMRNISYFSNYELKKYERIVNWVTINQPDEKNIIYQSDFYSFINEFDKRFNSQFLSIFPNYEAFFKTCEKSYLWQRLK